MINLCKQCISPRLTSNVLEKPVRSVETTTSLSNRFAVRSAPDIYSVKLPSVEAMNKIFGESK
jgi:hypothetical protein